MEAPRVPASEAMRLRVRLHTRWSDEDKQAVVNNAVYLTLLEETRLAYFRELGLMGEDEAFPFVLAQTNIRFVRPGRGGRAVEVEVATTHLGESSFTQAYRVRELASAEVWCEAEAVLVAWDGQQRCKRPMARVFREAVARFEGLAG